MSEPLVSTSWHRVATLRPALTPGLRIVRQPVREQVWHVLVEPASGRQIRLNPAGYALVADFDGQTTVAQVWERQLAKQRDEAPTQDETLRLLAQLFRGGMVRFDAAPHLSLLFARRSEETQRRTRGMMNPLMLRLPLTDPTQWLQRLAPLGAALFQPAAFIAWIAAVLVAVLAAGAHFAELQAHASRVFQTPSSYLIAWLAYPLVKLVHELGHGLAVRRYGGEVNELGISLMFLTPAPYVDASAANAFPQSRQRLAVSAAGIVVELGLACLALAIWFAVAPGIVRDVALVVVLICSISTVLFNANPLLKLDGYYMLCDALQLPNLAPRSQAWWLRRWRGWIGAAAAGPAPVLASGEAKWLVAYAPLAAVYRVALFLTLVFWAGRHSWVLGWIGGLLLAAWAARWIWRWATGSEQGAADAALRRRSLRAAAIVGVFVGVLLFAVPAPHAVVARGIVWPPDNAQLRAGAAGFVERLELPQGAVAMPGQPLVVLVDPVLAATREKVMAERGGLQSQQFGFLLSQPVRANELAEDLTRNDAELARVDEQLGHLEIRAGARGQVVWARPQDLPGSYVPRGAMLGHLLADGATHVRVALLEEDFLRTRGRVRSVEVRLADRPWDAHAARLGESAPGASMQLPAPALGDRHGGPVPVDPADPQGLRTRVPVFLLDTVLPDLKSSTIGGRAWVKLVLPPQPLALQWIAQLRQLLIKQFNPTGQV